MLATPLSNTFVSESKFDCELCRVSYQLSSPVSTYFSYAIKSGFGVYRFLFLIFFMSTPVSLFFFVFL